jgi:hypothetical protein
MREEINCLADVTVSDFLKLRGAKMEKLTAFIHARKFTGRQFERGQLAGPDGKLNVVCYTKQTAESIEADCSKDAPCLIWYAWKLRSGNIVLKPTEVPSLDIPTVMPQFTVTSASPRNKKLPSDYLKNTVWLGALSSAVKGVEIIPVSEELMTTADYLFSALEGRLNLHIAARVDRSKQQHWTLRLFT